jgi:hypothetical protein
MKNYVGSIKKNIILIIYFLTITGCYYGVEPEIVMSKGMQITAKTPEGKIVIIAGGDYERIYKWGNCITKVTHYPRKQRWDGSKGIYYPAFNCKECNGIKLVNAEEGQQHFDNIHSAIEWIKSKRGLCVYRNDGLVVGWDVWYQILSVEVWQILINGEKPTILEGSNDSLIAVDYLTEKETDNISSKIPGVFRYPSPEFPMLMYLYGIPIFIIVLMAIALIIHHKRISWHIAVLAVCFFILVYIMISLLGDRLYPIEYLDLAIPVLLLLGLGYMMWRKK